MDLIKKLGGYESLKREYEETLPLVQKGHKSQSLEVIRKALLEYRREHNIFEVGDSFVFNNGDNPEIMKVQHVWDDAVWGGYCGEIPKNTDIRHATDKEIAAGHRL